MCIIIAKDAGVKALDPEYFSRAWDSNGHGGGLVYKTPDGEVMYQKGFMNKEDFLNKIAEINQDENAFITHFRIRSVGEIKAENCHPFVMDNVTFAHNGTLSIQPIDGKTDSETFGLCFLKDKTMDWIKEYKVLLEMALGTSKFAIMDNITGEILILNKSCGEERDGAWFSNKSAFPVVSVPSYRGYCNYFQGDFDDTTTGWDGTYKPNKTLGTKQFHQQYQFWNENIKRWCYCATQQVADIWGISKNIIRNRKGLLELTEKIVPGDNLPKKKYAKGDKIFSVIVSAQAELNRELKFYRDETFKSYLDRDDAENIIHAMHIVLNAVRRLVVAKKEVCHESLCDFLESNIESNKASDNLAALVQLQCDAFLEDLKGAYSIANKR